MKFGVSVVGFLIFAAAQAAPQTSKNSLKNQQHYKDSTNSGKSKYNPLDARIMKQINKVNDDGSYTFGFEDDQGNFRVETRTKDGLVKGRYGFVDQDGKLRIMEYTAGESIASDNLNNDDEESNPEVSNYESEPPSFQKRRLKFKNQNNYYTTPFDQRVSAQTQRRKIKQAGKNSAQDVSYQNSNGNDDNVSYSKSTSSSDGNQEYQEPQFNYDDDPFGSNSYPGTSTGSDQFFKEITNNPKPDKLNQPQHQQNHNSQPFLNGKQQYHQPQQQQQTFDPSFYEQVNRSPYQQPALPPRRAPPSPPNHQFGNSRAPTYNQHPQNQQFGFNPQIENNNFPFGIGPSVNNKVTRQHSAQPDIYSGKGQSYVPSIELEGYSEDVDQDGFVDDPPNKGKQSSKPKAIGHGPNVPNHSRPQEEYLGNGVHAPGVPFIQIGAQPNKGSQPFSQEREKSSGNPNVYGPQQGYIGQQFPIHSPQQQHHSRHPQLNQFSGNPQYGGYPENVNPGINRGVIGPQRGGPKQPIGGINSGLFSHGIPASAGRPGPQIFQTIPQQGPVQGGIIVSGGGNKNPEHGGQGPHPGSIQGGIIHESKPENSNHGHGQPIQGGIISGSQYKAPSYDGGHFGHHQGVGGGLHQVNGVSGGEQVYHPSSGGLIGSGRGVGGGDVRRGVFGVSNPIESGQPLRRGPEGSFNPVGHPLYRQQLPQPFAGAVLGPHEGRNFLPKSINGGGSPIGRGFDRGVIHSSLNRNKQ